MPHPLLPGRRAHASRRVLNIAELSLGRSAQPGPGPGSSTPSAGTKRPRPHWLLDLPALPKARKLSQHSDAPSSRKLPPPPRSPAPSDSVPSENEGEAAAAWATELLSKPQTACATCRRPLDPLHSRWKNCERCREKQRAKARRRKERKEAAAGLVNGHGGEGASRGASTSSGVRTSSPGGTMDVDDEDADEAAGQRVRAKVKTKAKSVRSVWDEVPEFQTEDELLAAARRAVTVWRTAAGPPAAQFELCGGYAVVVGARKVDPAVAQQLARKLIAQGVP